MRYVITLEDTPDGISVRVTAGWHGAEATGVLPKTHWEACTRAHSLIQFLGLEERRRRNSTLDGLKDD